MSNKIKISVQILEETYNLECDPYEREIIINAAEYFNNVLKKFRSNNPRLSADKINILCGLEITTELIKERQTFEREIELFNKISGRILNSLEKTISTETIGDEK